MSSPRNPARPVRVHPVSGRLVGAVLGGVVLGVLVATFGTLVHRQWAPWMLVAALVATVSGGLWMRAWRGTAATAGIVVGWGVAGQLLAAGGPGGNVLVAAQPIGYVWLYGGMVAALVALVLPSRWFLPRADDDRVTPAA